MFGVSQQSGQNPDTALTTTTANANPALQTVSLPSTLSTLATTVGNDSTKLSSMLSGSSISNSKLLKDLIQSAHDLPRSDNVDLGSINLTLNELQRKSTQLSKKPSSDINYTKAHYLLTGSGINANEIESELAAIDVRDKSSFRQQALELSHAAPASIGDLDNYISNKKDENILNTIEQSLTLASKDFDNFINSNISIDWKVRRDELRKSIGLTNSTTASDKLNSSISWNKSVPGSYNVLSPLNHKLAELGKNVSSLKHLTREKFEIHANIIYQLNEARLNKQNFVLAKTMCEANKNQADLKSKQVSDAWRILQVLANEDYAKTNQEQKFFTLYQNNADNSSMNNIIIKNSRGYLEKEFYNYISELYSKDDKKSPEFEPANYLNRISYFIHNVIFKNKPELSNKTLCVNGTPIWASIFYLIRAGLYKEALQLTLSNQEVFNKFDKNFPVYLRKFVENDNHLLPNDINEKLHGEFNQQFQYIINDIDNADVGFDAYKYSVYKIIGKCDLSKRALPQSINLSIEDWLWFHFSIINEDQLNNEANLIFENYTLSNLQQKIISLGPKNFNTSSNNPTYLKTLVLAGLHELAVQYTFEFINECDAVHLAIGLNYYGLLRVSSFNNKDDLLIINNNEYNINFSRLIGSYTRSFKISDPKVACQYLILIAMTDNKEEVSKCHEALRELILISREFGILLGELNQSNGAKTPGLLERQRELIKLQDIHKFQHEIIEISAIKCQEEGRIFDALLLYQLCEEYDIVVSLINRLLAEILSSTELDKPIIKYGNYENDGEEKHHDTIDNNMILLAQHLMKIFNSNSLIVDKISSQSKHTISILLPIIDIRDLFYNKDWQKVLDEISKLNLIPIDEHDDLAKIRRLSALIQNNSVDENIKKVIPSLLIMTMNSLSQLNYSILTKRYQSATTGELEVKKLKTIAKNCMIYAGMVQYKMPRETYSYLINIESLL